MNNYVEPTWKEIYFLIKPDERKDTSFSANDVIRFYENNLDPFEMEEVLDYFCELCEEEIPDIEPDPLPNPLSLPQPNVPKLPPLFIPLPKPEVPKLPAPKYPPFLLPVAPFIIVPLLPPDILDFLKDQIGLKEAHAEIVSLESEIENLQAQLDWISWLYYMNYGRYVTKGGMIRREEQKEPLIDEIADIQVEMPPEIPEKQEEEPYDPWADQGEWWDEWYAEDDWWDEEEDYEDYEDEVVLDDNDNEEIEEFYKLYEEIKLEANRLGITIIFKYWAVSAGIRWYFFDINGDEYYYNISGVKELLRLLTSA